MAGKIKDTSTTQKPTLSCIYLDRKIGIEPLDSNGPYPKTQRQVDSDVRITINHPLENFKTINGDDEKTRCLAGI